MHKFKLFSTYIAAAMIVTVLSFFASKAMIEINAASPMPKIINTTYSADSEVNTYYEGVDGLKGEALLEALNGIISGHNEYSYTSTSHRNIFKIIDRNWDIDPLSPAQLANFDYVNDNGFIRKLYADYNDDVDTADRFKNDGASRVSFDREHIWAQSLGGFDRLDGAGSDFHSLLPADVKGNQQAHSNYNFAVPTSGFNNVNNDYGTYVGRNGYISGSTHKVFEPLEQYKGDIARAMFYMPARYYEWENFTHPKLTLVNGSPNTVTASDSQPGLAGDLATLLEWHLLDPIDEYEIRRNNLLYNNYQANRNPFIDHPEWAHIVYDPDYEGSGATTAPETSSVGDSPAWQAQNESLQSISVNTTNVITNYWLNDPLSTTGLIVTAHYQDTSSKTVFSYTTDPIDGATLSTPGTNTITVSYTENEITKTTTYNVSVGTESRTLQTISLNTSSVQTSFIYDDVFNSDNLIVTAYYDVGVPEQVEDYMIDAPDMGKIGSQDVEVNYQGKTASYSITITNQGAVIGEYLASDLFISEYIEGNSYNKALEIFNGTGETIDLSSYSLKLYSNGNTAPNFTLSLTGSLNNSETYSLAHTSANQAILDIVDEINNGINNFNGDDVVGLYKNDVLIDIIGEIGLQDNWITAYANGAGTLENRTLVRIPSVINPNNSFEPLEWNVYAQDTFTYLGSHTMTPYNDPEIFQSQAVAYATFFLEQTGLYCEQLDGGSVNWTYLSNEYGYMDNGTKDYFVDEATTNQTILNTRARYVYLINKYGNLASNQFMKDGDGTPYSTVNIDKPIITNTNLANNYYLIVLFGVMMVAGTFVIIKKRSITS